MHDQDGFAVDLLNLIWGDQVGHAHRLPARLSLPQHGMHGGEQGADVALLPLDPVQNLGHRQRGYKGSQGWPDLKQAEMCPVILAPVKCF